MKQLLTFEEWLRQQEQVDEGITAWALAGAITALSGVPTGATGPMTAEPSVVTTINNITPPIQEALELLKTIGIKTPPGASLRILDAKPSYMATNVIAFTLRGSHFIYVWTGSPEYQQVLRKSGSFLQVREARIRLAGAIAHEFIHASGDYSETHAYKGQIEVLKKLGASQQTISLTYKAMEKVTGSR